MEAVLYLALTIVSSNLIFAQDYTVPEPTIEVFTPKGFQISIPHEEGINLFAFHGNINVPMEGLDAGQFSRDILKRRGDRWVFEDKRSKLKKGDVIYYWLFVIKDSLGYRYDDGVFIVEGNLINNCLSFI
ncbi:hypothetical protein NQ314_000945 [Rhamnusium bicolor]|uniref:CBM39 domain-containing protein n=1 Tax=Rhamnusium bicolor TaxID=1586634 RepID=A0AAV8ZTZ6_9CUCU|nr:hypothetical protein NQ314_000945 [Rhamnusium bicolor]